MLVTGLFVACGGPGKLDGQPAVIATIELGGDVSVPLAIAVGEGGVWVADFGTGRVVRIDPEVNQVDGSSPYLGAYDVATGNGSVWFTNIDGNYVTRMDWIAQTAEQIDVGTAPTGVAVGEGSVWVANSDDGTVSRIDPLTNQVVSTISIGSRGLSDLVVGQGSVWITSFSGNRIFRVNARTDQIDGEVGVGARPFNLSVGEDAVWPATTSRGWIG